MSFKDTLKSIKDGVRDVSQLNVRTFTGEIKANLDNLPIGADGSPVDLKSFLKSAQVSGAIEVVGFTDMKIDGDIDQFITSSDFPMAIEAHLTAVESGREARQAILDLVKGAVKDAIPTGTGGD